MNKLKFLIKQGKFYIVCGSNDVETIYESHEFLELIASQSEEIVQGDYEVFQGYCVYIVNRFSHRYDCIGHVKAMEDAMTLIGKYTSVRYQEDKSNMKVEIYYEN